MNPSVEQFTGPDLEEGEMLLGYDDLVVPSEQNLDTEVGVREPDDEQVQSSLLAGEERLKSMLGTERLEMVQASLVFEFVVTPDGSIQYRDHNGRVEQFKDVTGQEFQIRQSAVEVDYRGKEYGGSVTEFLGSYRQGFNEVHRFVGVTLRGIETLPNDSLPADEEVMEDTVLLSLPVPSPEGLFEQVTMAEEDSTVQATESLLMAADPQETVVASPEPAAVQVEREGFQERLVGHQVSNLEQPIFVDSPAVEGANSKQRPQSVSIENPEPASVVDHHQHQVLMTSEQSMIAQAVIGEPVTGYEFASLPEQMPRQKAAKPIFTKSPPVDFTVNERLLESMSNPVEVTSERPVDETVSVEPVVARESSVIEFADDQRLQESMPNQVAVSGERPVSEVVPKKSVVARVESQSSTKELLEFMQQPIEAEIIGTGPTYSGVKFVQPEKVLEGQDEHKEQAMMEPVENVATEVGEVRQAVGEVQTVIETQALPSSFEQQPLRIELWSPEQESFTVFDEDQRFVSPEALSEFRVVVERQLLPAGVVSPEETREHSLVEMFDEAAQPYVEDKIQQLVAAESGTRLVIEGPIETGQPADVTILTKEPDGQISYEFREQAVVWPAPSGRQEVIQPVVRERGAGSPVVITLDRGLEQLLLPLAPEAREPLSGSVGLDDDDEELEGAPGALSAPARLRSTQAA